MPGVLGAAKWETHPVRVVGVVALTLLMGVAPPVAASPAAASPAAASPTAASPTAASPAATSPAATSPAATSPAATSPAAGLSAGATQLSAGEAAGCPGQQAPPPPAAREETSTPAPLPWPAEPVGGAALGACGDVGPAAQKTVTSASYVLADLDTGTVLAARAPHARERPASTLKILTSLVVVDQLKPDAVVEGTPADLRVDGSKAGIGPGGNYTVRQLMAGLLLSSGNDTAEALARALGGDAATLAAMSAMAQRHGAMDTRPATPSGLDGPGMSSSAYDLAVLFRAALTKPLFADTIETRMVAFPGYGDKPGFMLGNNDRFVPSYLGAIAAKSGFTDAARHTLVATAQRGNRRLIVALMRGEQHPVSMDAQAAALLDMGFALPTTTAAVGTLVDAPPATATPAPAPAPGGAPSASPRGPTSPSWPWWLAGAALVAVTGAALARLRNVKKT
jgi:D-alanyl-D-alanine carboxypeptidase (penicillin-binding protein 5/6)